MPTIVDSFSSSASGSIKTADYPHEMSIANRIREGRKRLGLSEQQFGEAVGVSRGAVQQWESGATAPKRANQKAVADLLGITVGDLMDDNFPASKGEAHAVSLRGITVSPSVEWGDLMTTRTLPPVFKVAAPDDALAPTLRAGQHVEITRDIQPRPGDGVLVRDRSGEHYLRVYRERRKGEWSAAAQSPAFEPLESARDGLTVVGVVTATAGRWSS
jgi:DNA-binding XRE family transcriptional regulator